MTIIDLFHLIWGLMLGVAITGSFIGYRKRTIRKRDIPAGQRFVRK